MLIVPADPLRSGAFAFENRVRSRPEDPSRLSFYTGLEIGSSSTRGSPGSVCPKVVHNWPRGLWWSVRAVMIADKSI